MWKITEDKTLAGCGRWPVSTAAGIGLEYDQDAGNARMLGLQNSHSAWGSPLAAVAIMRAKSDSLESAVSTWLAGAPGRAVAVFTGTVAHSSDQALSDVWDNLAVAWQGVTGNSRWKRAGIGARDRYGVTHWSKSVEATVGRINGWHVHQHTLFFLDRALSGDELADLKGTIHALWATAAVRAGYKAPTFAHGVDIQQTTADTDAARVAAYVTKGMTAGTAAGAAAEVTGGAAKDARRGNRTPFQLLDDIADALDAGEWPARDIALWREWEAGSKGREQSRWSRGAKDALGVLEVADEDVELDELMDDRLTDDTEDQDEDDDRDTTPPYVVAVIDVDAWRLIANDTDTRRDLLRYVADARDEDDAGARAHLFLQARGITHRRACVPVDTGPAPWAAKVDRDAARAVLPHPTPNDGE